MSTRPYLPISNVYNPSLFSFESDYLTLADADLRYVRIGGDINANSINCNSLYIAGNLVDVSAISGVTPGTITASKAVIVNANKDITGFRNITSTGTITSNSTITNGLTLNGSLSSTANMIDSSSSLRITNGSVPSSGNGGGFRFSGMNATFYISSHNHMLNTHNRIDIQDALIYTSADTDTPALCVGFNTTTPKQKWDYNQASSTSNRLRMSYSVNSVYGELYSESSGYISLDKTPVVADNSTKVASTAFVQSEFLDRASSTFSPSGFQNQTDSVINYDANTRILTISPVSSSFTVWVKGTKHVYTTTQTATAHTNAVGTYIFYFDDNGVLQWSTTLPSYANPFVADVYYYDASHTLILNEKHGCEMDFRTHIELHNTQGTWYRHGLSLSGYTVQPASPANSDNTFASSAGQIADEDLYTDIGAVADGSSYTVMYLVNASSQWTFSFGNTVPYNFGTYIKYNQWNGSTWLMTDVANGDYVNYYVVYIPSIQSALQMVLIPSQTIFSSLVNAVAEDFNDLSLGALSSQVPEYLVRYRITFRANAAYTSSGKCRIEQLDMIVGSRAIIQNAVATNHQSLSGLLLAGAGNQYGHIDDQAQTIAGVKTFSSNPICTLATASQPNITSLGTLTGLGVAGVISCTTNARPLTMYKSDLTSGSAISYVLGKSSATDQQGEVTFTYSSSANQSTLSLGHYGNPQCLQVYSSGLVNIPNGTDASSATTGCLTLNGGLGVNKKLYVGSTTDATSTTTGALVVAGGIACQLQIVGGKLSTTGQCVCGQLNVGGTLSTVTGTQLNYLDILSAGGAQASKAMVLDANLDFGACRRFKTQKLMVGTDYTDTGRMITCLDSSVVAGDTRYLLTGGQANTSNNSCELSYFHSANNSSNNEFRIGYNGGTLARFRFDGVIMNGAGTQLFNASGQLVSAINTTNTITTTGNVDINNTGRLRHYTPLGAQFFNSADSNVTEGRIYCSGYNMYVGAQSDSAVRLITNGSTRLYVGANATGGGNCSFHGTSTSFPLSIEKSDGSSTSSYHYWNSTGADGSGNNTGATVSLYCSGRIMCNGEIDVISDARVKKDIKPIKQKFVDRFIDTVEPKCFIYKQEQELSYGYIAQECIKQGLSRFVQMHDMPNMEETTDEDGFVSPKDKEFSINTGSFIPLLHIAIKQQREEIKELKEINKDLQVEIDNINRRLDMMMTDRDEQPNMYDHSDEFYTF